MRCASLTLTDVIVAEQEGGEGRLAAPAPADHRHHGAARDAEAESREDLHLGTTRVAEEDVSELDVAHRWRQWCQTAWRRNRAT